MVFGSRSILIAGDARENRPIKIDSGAMVRGVYGAKRAHGYRIRGEGSATLFSHP